MSPNCMSPRVFQYFLTPGVLVSRTASAGSLRTIPPQGRGGPTRTMCVSTVSLEPPYAGFDDTFPFLCQV